MENNTVTPNYPPIISSFLERKQNNINNILKQNYFIYELDNKKILVKYDGEGNIIDSPCVYCKNSTNRSPFSYDAYVGTYCKECFPHIKLIEDFINKKTDEPIKSRRTKDSPENVNIDWGHVDKLIKNRKAKLTLLAEKYNIYNSEMKELLNNKYGNRIVYKKGRGGGIQFKENSTS